AADWRCAAVSELREGRPEAFRGFADQPAFAEAAGNIFAGVDANRARFETAGWTRYDGSLRDATLRERLHRRFPDDYQFSATQLERYAGCRFRFFLSDVLKIEPLEPPTVATDYRSRGILFHDVLADVHRQLADDDTGGGIDPDVLVRRFQEQVDRQLDRRVAATELAAALTEVERLLFADWSEAYAEQWADYDRAIGEVWRDPPQPAHLELPFGDVPGEDSDRDDLNFGSLDFGGDQKRTRVRGRIDRVDVGVIEGRTVYTVVDYKTGRPPRFAEEDVRSGKAIQLVLYTLAVKRLSIVAENAEPFQFGYWNIRETGFVPGLKGRIKPNAPLDAAVLQSLEELLEELIPWLADGIRRGDFPVDSDDDHCGTYCPYPTVCRITQIRPLRDALQKTRDPGPSADLSVDG
ncbi:MAG: PD-(D/E)XK nuclease family protein, partial [Planctomycetaceae bacterium]